jgi:hypothetical protein
METGEVTIENNSIVRFDRSRHGGGVPVYARKGLNFDVGSDLVGDGLKSLFVDVIFSKTRPIVSDRLTCFFSDKTRSGSQPDQGLTQCCTMYILGDFNICFKRDNPLHDLFSDINLTRIGIKCFDFAGILEVSKSKNSYDTLRGSMENIGSLCPQITRPTECCSSEHFESPKLHLH